jgi:Polysaccharide pyruvyl transferase.
MKIGILTIVDYDNYGNRLQNYALQKVMQNMGHEVLTVKNFHGSQASIFKRIFKILDLTKIIPRLRYHDINRKRSKNFEKFTQKYINESKKSYFSVKDDYNELSDVDCFVIGSDQVWNYTFSRFSDIDFGMFTTKPKISYAASFGVSTVPAKLKAHYSEGLNVIESISVREDVGQEIVEELTDRKATVVLDPTFLITKSEWADLTKNCPVYKHKFVLTYFLGEVDRETAIYIRKYAESNKLLVKNLGNRHDKELWEAGPEEFVNLFSQTEKVFTDSFHACVFSIIFGKDFEVFERSSTNGSMNSRIETLLRKLNIEDRWHSYQKQQPKEIDYLKVNDLLNGERVKSIDFLKKSLNELI